MEHNNSSSHDLTSESPETQPYHHMDPNMQPPLPMQPMVAGIPNQYGTYLNAMVPMQPMQTIPPVSVPAPDFAVPVPNPPNATAATSNTSLPKTLWMGDLDPWSDEESIVNLWLMAGKRVMVKLIKAKRGTPAAALNTGHAGYCFVEFETFEDAKEALTLNGTPIANTNRIFRLNWASGATLTSTIPQSAEYSLFVGDLAPTTTEAHLLALFQSHFNSVKTVRVMTDPITGTSRCFGFVRFSDEEERTRALNTMNGMWCLGRPLRVALAAPRSQALNAGPNNGHPSHYGFDIAPNYANPVTMYQSQQSFIPNQDQFGIAGDPNDFAIQQMSQDFQSMNLSSNSQQQQKQQQQQQQSGFTDPKNTTVFIGGLAPGIMEPMLAQVFQPFGKIMHVKIPPGKGCGFIRFDKREEAENAIAGLQGFQIGGTRVRLSWGRQQNPNRNNIQGGYPNSPGSGSISQLAPQLNYQYSNNMARSGMIPNASSAGYLMSEYPLPGGQIPLIPIHQDQTQPEFSNSSYNSSYEHPDSPEPSADTAEATTAGTTNVPDFPNQIEINEKQTGQREAEETKKTKQSDEVKENDINSTQGEKKSNSSNSNSNGTSSQNSKKNSNNSDIKGKETNVEKS